MAAIDLFELQRHPSSGLPSAVVVALVGLAFEAKIASAPNVFVLCGRDGRKRFEDDRTPMASNCRALVSFGVAGGISPHLKPGDLVVASSIVDAQRTHRTDASWCKRLLASIPEAHHMPIVGVDAPVVDPRDKRDLAERTGAAAVDMESHVVARSAASRGLSFVAIRVIVDPAHRSVPHAALAGMRPDGTTSLGAVLTSLASKPTQLFSMARIGLDMFAARNALMRVRERLGHGFGLVDAADSEFKSTEMDLPALFCGAAEASTSTAA